MCEKIQPHCSTEFDDPDFPILYVEKFNEYGLKIFDGGSSFILISHCPFCGETLPESKRDQWFDAIEKLGLDPWIDDLPEKFETGEWFQENKDS
ncbi:MAG: hypothetical protein RL607_248 [Bacteroidota bacterium]|jgi:hypothetical protein